VRCDRKRSRIKKHPNSSGTFCNTIWLGIFNCEMKEVTEHSLKRSLNSAVRSRSIRIDDQLEVLCRLWIIAPFSAESELGLRYRLCLLSVKLILTGCIFSK